MSFDSFLQVLTWDYFFLIFFMTAFLESIPNLSKSFFRYLVAFGSLYFLLAFVSGGFQ